MSNPCPPEQAIVANLALGDPVANPRGGKACSITPAIRLTLQDVTTPFQVIAYDGTSSRKSLDLRSTPELRDFCARLDAKLEPLARRLGNVTYTSLLKPQKGDYEPLLRYKITINETGRSPTKI